MKKLIPLAGLLLLASANLSGDYNSSNAGCPAPKCPPKPACGCPCDEEATGKPGACLNMAYLPCASKRTACGVGLAISADFIYWTARQDGLGYAVTNWASADDVAIANADNLGPGRGSVKHPDFGFDPGFKVGLELETDHDCWTVRAEYTWLFTSDATDSNTQTTEDGNASSGLGALWYGRGFGPVGAGNMTGPDTPMWSYASTTWDLHFQTLDFNLSRDFYVSHYLSLRPHFGFKASWQTQDYTNKYVLNQTLPVKQTQRFSWTQDYWGFGMRAGFDTAWYFTDNWSIYGDVALSALWSQFKVKRRDRSDANTNDNTPAYNNFDTENSFHKIVPVLEFGIGLRWEMWTCDDAFHFLIQAGWEEQIWMGMNQLFGHYEQGAHGDLNTQGFTLKLRFGF